ncbi:hypothetical protein M5D96_007623, partial [Drosophila gunungcola]
VYVLPSPLRCLIIYFISYYTIVKNPNHKRGTRPTRSTPF